MSARDVQVNECLVIRKAGINLVERSVIETIRSLQRKKGTVPHIPREGDRIGFALNSKDRVEFTLQALQGIHCEPGFDLIWNDGSDTPEGKSLPRNYNFKNVRLVEVNLSVKGGPDRAICFSLERLLDLRYDYVGLIENDVVLQPGWFSKLMELFRLGADDGLVCGAATARNYQSRVLEYQSSYTINWNTGAGMVLFTREAAQLLLDRYSTLPLTAQQVRRFYAEAFGVDLTNVWELFYGRFDRRLGLDWSYSPFLYRQGFASLGTIPSFARDLEFELTNLMHTHYVSLGMTNAGPAHPKILRTDLWWMRASAPLYRSVWATFGRFPLVEKMCRALSCRFKSMRARRRASS